MKPEIRMLLNIKLLTSGCFVGEQRSLKPTINFREVLLTPLPTSYYSNFVTLEVTYTTEALAMTDRKTREGMKLMGLDPASAKCRAKCLAGAASHGPEARAVCERDLATAQEWLSKVGIGNIKFKYLTFKS